ncbi:4a-hydroxytetrahydrobiopterin dehydratase [Kaarinaea lacus]
MGNSTPQVCDLTQKNCKPCEGGVKPLDRDEATGLLNEVPGWELNSDASEIHRTYSFKDFHRTMAFVNAVAWIAHQEDHHPDLAVSYSRCEIHYSTHAIGGLSENDFICAAKIDALLSAGDQ